MKPLTLEETALKEEMKERCLAKGQYIDEKAKDKFKMLCHLEDFEVQYWELQEENKQLKIQISAREEVCNRLESNWNKLKECIKECLEAIDTIQKLTGNAIENYTPRILTYNQIKDKMQELEQGSDE